MEQIYVVTELRPKSVGADQLLSVPDADSQGRVLFRSPVASNKFTESLTTCIQATKEALQKAANLADGYVVDEIKLKLGVDASVGCTFLGEGKFDASIEVTIKRA